MKRIAGNCVFFLIVFGILINCGGWWASSPIITGVGSAMFIAGFLTPHVALNSYSSKRLFWFCIWLLISVYFAFQGDVSWLSLSTAMPLTIASVQLSKWAGTEFSEKTVE